MLPLLNQGLWKEDSIESIVRPHGIGSPGFQDAWLLRWEDMSFDITRLQLSPLYPSVIHYVQTRIPPKPTVSPKL